MSTISLKTNRVIELKQTTRAIKEEKAKHIFIAKDASSNITLPIVSACKKNKIKITYVESMKALGESVGIDVGAAVVAELI